MKTKIIAIILAIAAIASAAIYFVTKKNDEEPPVSYDVKPLIYSFDESPYTLSEAERVLGQNGEIFMPTDFENVFYTMDIGGNVAFFEFMNGTMLPCSEQVKTVKANFSASFETMNATVSYIEKNGKVCGYGLFTADKDNSVDIYAYAFMKLINKPEAYGTGHMLMVDFEKENFHKTNKIYSELYSIDISSGKTSKFVSENTRLVGKDGALRDDWTMLTDSFINNLGNKKYFISSRYYTREERGLRADIMELSSAYRPKIVVKDILGIWFVNDEYGMHYLKKSEKGFKNILNNGAENVLGEFEGDLFGDYLISGNYVLNKNTLVMTHLITGVSYVLKDIDVKAASGISVSPDGSKLVIYYNGIENENGAMIQKLVYCTTDGSSEAVTFKEPLLFSESCDFVWLDSNNIMSVRALSGDGASVGSVIYSF